MSPLISIIVLSFNSERHISNCLEAIKSQTYQNFEVFVVDAGSNDRTIKILEEYQSVINLRVFRAPNTTMGEARNIGIKHASGEFLAFCDSDDVFLPEKLASQVEKANKVTYGKFVIFSNHVISTEGEIKKIRLPRDNSNFMKKNSFDVLRWQGCNLSGMLVKHFKDKPIMFTEGPGGRYGEDWQYNIALYLDDYRFVHCPGFFSSVTERSDSHTTLEMQYLLIYYVLLKVLTAEDYFKKQGYKGLVWLRIITPFVIKFHLASAFVIHLADYEEKYRLIQIYCNYKTLFLIRPLIWPLQSKWILRLLLKIKRNLNSTRFGDSGESTISHK